MKATHTGHCQICGRLQKLPGGHLSLHGYTVAWGGFNGTCSGARGLPFEQSIDLIQNAIADAEGEATSLHEQATALESDYNPSHVWLHVWYQDGKGGSYRGEKSGYVWQRFDVTEEAVADLEKGWVYLPRTRRGTPVMQRWNRLTFGGSAYHVANVQRAEALRRMADEAREYAEWQRRRIEDWQPQPLTALP